MHVGKTMNNMNRPSDRLLQLMKQLDEIPDDYEHMQRFEVDVEIWDILDRPWYSGAKQ